MMQRQLSLRSLVAVCAVFALAAEVPAQETAKSAPKTPPPADPRALIVKKVDGIKLEDVRLSVIPGVYEVTREGTVAYVTADARYVMAGDIYDLDTDANLTENRRRTIRQQVLSSVPDAQMIVFAPKEPRYTVTVFTDIDCGYCQQLHSQIAEYNRLGIAVRYLMYPRTGPKTESWEKAERVWCATNKRDALTRAKRGETIKSPKCGADAVARDYELAQTLSLRGTPSIFLPSGELIPGYLTPAGLVDRLRSKVTQ
jgi:thiol:disulfide interchange protein DsbC